MCSIILSSDLQDDNEKLSRSMIISRAAKKNFPKSSRKLMQLACTLQERFRI